MKYYQIHFKTKNNVYLFCPDIFLTEEDAKLFLKDKIYPVMKYMNPNIAIDAVTRNLVVMSSHYEWFVQEKYLD